MAELRTGFFATPYRPTGLTTSARTLVRLVDELVWLTRSSTSCRRGTACATVDPAGVRGEDRRGRRRWPVAPAAAATRQPAPSIWHAELDATAGRARVTGGARHRDAAGAARRPTPVADATVGEFVTSLEPSFRAQEMSFAISAIAANIELTAAAQQRSWWQQLLGHQPGGVPGRSPRPSSAPEPTSSGTRCGCTTACGARSRLVWPCWSPIETGVQHSFWVVLGTLSVLRSNALEHRPERAARPRRNGRRLHRRRGAGLAIGTNTTLLWFLLPLAILLAGLAPAISFAAGQAGFTVTLVILFNIIEPAGWQVGLVRVEDIAIGCAVSLAVGALFWPRGAGSALGQALAEAYSRKRRLPAPGCRRRPVRCDASMSPRRARPRRTRRPPPRRPAGWTTRSAASWPSAAPNTCRWPRCQR